MIKKIFKSDFVKGIVSIGTGNIIGQAISVLTLPILSRIYSQSAYGEYGVIVSMTSIFTSFISLGLTSAIMEPKNDEESRQILSTAVTIQSIIIATLFFILVAIQNTYKLFNISGSYTVGLLLMCGYAYFANLSLLVYTYVNRLGKNRILLLNPIIRAFAILLVAMPLGFWGCNYIGFMLAYILAEVISSLQMIIRVHPFRLQSRYNISTFKLIIVRYRKYILLQCPANAIGTLGVQFPTQFLARLFSTVALGSYTMCSKVIALPVTLLAKPISNIYFRTISEKLRNEEDIADFTYKIVRFGLLLCIVPLILVIFWGKPLFGLVLGEQWSEAGEIAAIIGIQYVFMFIAQCLSFCRVAMGQQKINLLYSVCDAVITTVVCFIGYFIDGSLMTTITVITIGKCMVYITDIMLDFICMKKLVFKVSSLLLVYVSICFLLIFSLR